MTRAAEAGPAPAPAAPTPAQVALRRRATVALFVTAALLNAAMAAVAPASTIFAAGEIGVMWGALPQALTILGTGLGALMVARNSGRFGWRGSLAISYAVAMVGAGISFAAVLVGEIVSLCFGMSLLGLGVGGAVICRYAAAELYPAERRGFAIGVVISAGAVGAIGGPLLLEPVSAVARGYGWHELSGAFLLATLACGLAWLGLLSLPGGRPDRAVQGSAVSGLRPLLRAPGARALLTVMVISQLVMVAIMTAAPLDIHSRHLDLTLVGTALAAHTTGMFVLSPLTGWIIDRIGSRPVMFAGLVVLVLASGIAATASQDHPFLPDLALFLLGYGWNLCFMAGSRRLSVTIPVRDQGQVVGGVDAVVWSVSATATLGGTALLAIGGYSMLAVVAGVLPVVAVVVLLASRPGVRDVEVSGGTAGS